MATVQNQPVQENITGTGEHFKVTTSMGHSLLRISLRYGNFSPL